MTVYYEHKFDVTYRLLLGTAQQDDQAGPLERRKVTGQSTTRQSAKTTDNHFLLFILTNPFPRHHHSPPEVGLISHYQAAETALSDEPDQPQTQPGQKTGAARWFGDGRRQTQHFWPKMAPAGQRQRGSRVVAPSALCRLWPNPIA